MIDMTKAEVLAIWKGFVRNMSDQGAVFPFANEIASRVRNELLARVEAAEKERENANAAAAGIALQAETLQAECDALRKELMATHKMAMNGTEWRDLAKKYAARIEEMERQEPYAFALYSGLARKAVYLSEIEACEQRDRRQLTADLGGSLEAYRVVPLYLAPGAQPAPSVPDGWKLVPIEPTQEMSEAGVFAGGIYYDVVDAVYEAMIKIAPEPKQCP